MLKNTVIFIIALLGFGMIRLPLQERILEQEKNAGLLEEPVNLSSSDYLEQQLAMVSLGGLRSLVAAVLSMEAFDCFLISDWTNLERRYNQITALAPHSDFYWDNGSWHLEEQRFLQLSGQQAPFPSGTPGRIPQVHSEGTRFPAKGHQGQSRQLVPVFSAGQHVQRYVPPAGF